MNGTLEDVGKADHDFMHRVDYYFLLIQQIAFGQPSGIIT